MATAAAAAPRAHADARASAGRSLGLLERPTALEVVRVALTGREGCGKSALAAALLPSRGGAAAFSAASRAAGRHHARTPGVAVHEAVVQLPRSGRSVVLSIVEAGGSAAAQYPYVAAAPAPAASAAIHVVAPSLAAGAPGGAADALRTDAKRCDGIPGIVVSTARGIAAVAATEARARQQQEQQELEQRRQRGSQTSDSLSLSSGGSSVAAGGAATAAQGASPGGSISTASTTSSSGVAAIDARRAELRAAAESLGMEFLEVDSVPESDGNTSSPSADSMPPTVGRLLEKLEDLLL